RPCSSSRPCRSRRARPSPIATRWPRSPRPSCRRSPRRRWPTSTPTTSMRRRRSSPAPRARWASTSSDPGERKMAKHGKAYLDAKQRFDRGREYTPAEAIALVKQLGTAKFDESVEVHVRTGLNVRHADEQLRGTIALPNGLGKEVKIAVFAQ